MKEAVRYRHGLVGAERLAQGLAAIDRLVAGGWRFA